MLVRENRVPHDSALGAGLIDVLRSALMDTRAVNKGTAAMGLSVAKWQPSTPEDKAAFLVGCLIAGMDAGLDWEEDIAPAGDAATKVFLHALNSDLTPLTQLGTAHLGNLAETHATAASLLGRLRAKEAVPALIQALSEPEAARQAAEALGEIGDPVAVEPLIALLRGPEEDSDIRVVAMQSLGKLKDPRAVPVLLEIIGREGNEALWSAAAEALGTMGDLSAVPGLVKLLSSDKSGVRSIAVRTLGTLKANAAAPALVDTLKVEQSESFKYSLAIALGNIGDPAGAEGLAQLAFTQGDSVVTGRIRQAAVEGLGKMGDAGAAPLIRVLSQSESEGTRVAAAKQLGDMNSVAAVKALGDAISLDPSGKVSSEAALALGRLNDPSAVQALVAALDAMSNSDLFLNRADAPIEALALSKEPSSTEAMAQAMAKCLENPRIVMNGQYVNGKLLLQLAVSLADRGDLRAKPVLEKMSENPGTRVPALAALAKLGGAPPVAEPAATPTPPATTGLEGSTWKLGDFELTFKDATTFHLKGGSVPEGMDVDYKVEDGVFTATVMDQTKTGTWDGTTLTIDDKKAEKQP
jgi:HEAT repeat protein